LFRATHGNTIITRAAKQRGSSFSISSGAPDFGLTGRMAPFPWPVTTIALLSLVWLLMARNAKVG